MILEQPNLAECDICGKKMAADRHVIPGCCVECEDEGLAQLGYPVEEPKKRRREGQMNPTWIASAARAVSREDAGYVYVLSNPAWPDCVKVGKTSSLDRRLSDYNVCAPYKDFQIDHAEHCADRHYAEYRVHRRLAEYKLHGEWFRLKPAKAVEIVKRTMGKDISDAPGGAFAMVKVEDQGNSMRA